jgi:hypothetical protein
VALAQVAQTEQPSGASRLIAPVVASHPQFFGYFKRFPSILFDKWFGAAYFVGRFDIGFSRRMRPQN